MSTSYRKTGSREFYKAVEETKIVVRVLNKESFSRIDISENRLIYEDAFDEAITKESTEVEFNAAYKLAFERITLQRLDI